MPRALLPVEFGDVKTEMLPPTLCEARQAGMPAFLAEWFVACVEGFVPVALRKADAKSPTFT